MKVIIYLLVLTGLVLLYQSSVKIANACDTPGDACGTCTADTCSDGSECAAGHTYCVWDPSGNYCGSCSKEVDNCSTQCSGGSGGGTGGYSCGTHNGCPVKCTNSACTLGCTTQCGTPQDCRVDGCADTTPSCPGGHDGVVKCNQDTGNCYSDCWPSGGGGGSDTPPIPSKNCSVSLSSNSVSVGNSVTADYSGKGNQGTTLQDVNLWVERADKQPIPGTPPGSPAGDSTVTYYSLGQCWADETTGCSDSKSVSLPVGNYYFHCDMPSSPYKCSGNPFCSGSEEGKLSCTGWVACSDNDAKFFSVTNTVPHGSFDSADCIALSGWTCDPDSWSTSIPVHFYLDVPAGSPGEKLIADTIASNERVDLGPDYPDNKWACNFTTKHGYSVPTPNIIKDGQIHSIYAHPINYPSGQNPYSSGSGKTINCSKLTNVSCSASPSSINTGEQATWTASATGGIEPYTYTWSGHLNGETGKSVNKTYLTAGTYSASVTVTSTDNQTATANCSNSVSVTNIPLVTSCTLSRNPIFATESASWSTTVSGGLAPFSYSWSGSAVTDQLPHTTSSINQRYLTAGTYNATVQITSSDGQIQNPPCQTLTVNPATPAWIQVTGDVHSNSRIKVGKP